METINDRIEAIVNKQFNGNKAAFAAALGMGPTIMSSYLGEKHRVFEELKRGGGGSVELAADSNETTH